VTTSSPAVEIKRVTVVVSGGFTALTDITVDLPAGRIIGFIGPSGAGKTTLIRAIVGRQHIAKGGLKVLGLPAGAPGLRSQLSYMTQNLSVYPDLTAAQNLQYFAVMIGVSRRDLAAVVAESLHIVDLAPQAGQLAGSLSGGQKQRLSLAIALLGQPKLLVLDEPTVGLDPVLRQQIWTLFHGLRDAGATLIVSSHVMDEAARCDDLVLIRDGRLLAHDTPASLCQHTHTTTVEQAFLKLVEDGK
jgi:ABC-2 type transport system ATP-binding protein